MYLKFNRRTKSYMAVVRTASGIERAIHTHQHLKSDAKRISKEAKLEELEYAAAIGKLSNEAISFIQSDKKITLAKALEDWKEWMRITLRSVTAHDYQIVVRAWLRGVDVDKASPRVIDDKHVYDWINDPDWDAKANTRTVKLAAIKSFCKFCYQENYIGRDPSARIKVSLEHLTHAQKQVEKRSAFTEDEIGKLLSAFKHGDFWHVAVSLGRYAGLRIGDVCRLEWASFAQPGMLTVWTHKRNKVVNVPIHPMLEQTLKAIPKNESNFVFPEDQEMICDPRARSGASVKFILICRKLGILGKSFHDLRRTYCTEMSERGVSTDQIGRYVGHSRAETTERYIARA